MYFVLRLYNNNTAVIITIVRPYRDFTIRYHNILLVRGERRVQPVYFIDVLGTLYYIIK